MVKDCHRYQARIRQYCEILQAAKRQHEWRPDPARPIRNYIAKNFSFFMLLIEPTSDNALEEKLIPSNEHNARLEPTICFLKRHTWYIAWASSATRHFPLHYVLAEEAFFLRLSWNKLLPSIFDGLSLFFLRLPFFPFFIMTKESYNMSLTVEKYMFFAFCELQL